MADRANSVSWRPGRRWQILSPCRSVAAVGELTGRDRLLLDAIIAALEKDGQFVFLIDGDETAAIENVQALARY